MITERELLDAIRECEAAPVTYSTCEKLACFYTLYEHLFGEKPEAYRAAPVAYSFAPQPIAEPTDTKKRIYSNGGSDFLIAIDGKDMDAVLKVVDDLLDTIRVLNPRVYNGMLKKLNACPE